MNTLKGGMRKMRGLYRDRVLGGIVILVVMFFAYHTSKLSATGYVGDPGPKMFPLIGCIIGAFCGIILFVRPSKAAQEVFLTREQLFHTAVLFGVYVLYVFLLWFIGFTATVPVILFIISLLFSEVSNEGASLKSRVVRSLVYSLAVSVCLYMIYIVLLNTQLTSGVLWKLLKA